MDAESQSMQGENEAFELEQRKQRIFALRETVAVTVRVLLGVMTGTVSLSQDRQKLDISDQTLAHAVRTAGLENVLHAIVDAVETVWKRLTGILSDKESDAEQQKVAQVLKPLVEGRRDGFKP